MFKFYFRSENYRQNLLYMSTTFFVYLSGDKSVSVSNSKVDIMIYNVSVYEISNNITDYWVSLLYPIISNFEKWN